MSLQIDFAPLQGFTDAVYRNAHATHFGGIDSYYTPFVRIERGDFRTRDMREITVDTNTVSHLVPQAIGGEPAEFRRIVERIASEGYKEIDINMGCPFPLQVRKHKGSGILPDTERVAALLDVARSYEGEIDFSIKMRLGQHSSDECIALLPLLNDTPLSHITMHARLGIDHYKGACRVDDFVPFYEGCTHPLYYNGDLCSVADIDEITARFPRLAGVALGRGLLADPSLATAYREGEAWSKKKLYRTLLDFHAELLEYYSAHLQGDAQLLSRLKPHWEYLLPTADRKRKKAIHKSQSMRNYLLAVEMLLMNPEE